MIAKNKRIIFALLYSDGYFHLSRNFTLQKVGDYNWLEKNYNFQNNCENIDELAFVLVKRKPKKEDIFNFLKEVEKIRKNIFAPIIIGGGIKNLMDAKTYFENGADKILINSMSLNSNLINEIASIYGEQAITINLDYKLDKNKNENLTYANCGRETTNLTLEEHLNKLNKIKFGEIILHSMDRDGTGNGFDIHTIETKNLYIRKPILLMGGAGKPDHMVNALKNEKISGVISANIFNFMGNALKKSRELAIKEKINVAFLN